MQLLLQRFVLFISIVLSSALADRDTITITRNNDNQRYTPTWESLDSRPLPTWYDDAKIGIFMHWGVYSVPSFGSEWFWAQWKSNSSKYVEFMKKNYPPGFQYQDFARDFTAELYDPNKWVDLFKRSGAKYIVLTSKHHEGFTLFPSKYTFGWNAKDVGPHRDLLGELASALRNNTDLRFGLYYSLYEWYNPMYLADKSAKFKTREFSKNKMTPEMMQLVDSYKPEIWWSDGDWEAQDIYFGSRDFISWLYNDSPVKDTVVVNDRWGSGIPCHHGDFYTCQDRYNPGVLQPHKWENAMTLDRQSWGFRREASLADYLSIEQLLETLAMTVSCGGNLLMNVGPTREGTIAPLFEERLLQVGEWLQHNGAAIYGSQPWIHQNETESRVWYTFKENAVYAISLDWPGFSVLKLERSRDLFVDGATVVTMLGMPDQLHWDFTDDHKQVNVFFPDRALVPVRWAWVLKINQE